ncbi:two-component system OmpR family sensor kinase [Nocardia sp. GAS34]|uniref:sensor histidine kinase n=1 Tax=unclassified Nocardia TaxID=2637762 RepID=UPI003D19F9E0
MRRLPAWLRPSRWGLRIRSAVVAALVVGVVLLAAAAAMLALLRHSLVREVEVAADTRAGQIADELQRGDGDQVPDGLLATDGGVSAVQVIAADGRMAWASSPKLRAPLAPLPVPARALGLHAAQDYAGDLRVAARTVDTTSGTYTILVAADTEPSEHALAEVAALLAMGGPVVVLTAAAATYLLVGRSLRSVEAIRARVARIEATGLAQRVPVPVARDEIAWLAETMNEMLARVEAGHQAQRRFVGDASHELRSPLATITAALELARDRPQALDRDLIEGTLLPETGRMRHLIEDLLTLAAADEHGLELRIGEVDLDDLAGSEAAMLRLRGDVEIRTTIAAVRVIGDRAKLARALRNIADNAAAHARSKVSIGVEFAESSTAARPSGDAPRPDAAAGFARITVDDDGPGIPPDERQRVFDRFVRLEADRARSSGGSGLGLAIVAEIVAAHGGSVTVGESRWGGARFVVRLPVTGPVGVQQPVADPA